MRALNVTIATGNIKKFTEIHHTLQEYGIVSEHTIMNLPEIQDLDAERIIRGKIVSAFNQLQRPVLVDDSGIYFQRYPQFPGAYSKDMFHALGMEGIFHLVQEGDRATFRCFVAYMDRDCTEPFIFRGICHGHIGKKQHIPRDTIMPYAYIFIPNGSQKSLVNMTSVERAHDHRHQALRAFADWFL